VVVVLGVVIELEDQVVRVLVVVELVLLLLVEQLFLVEQEHPDRVTVVDLVEATHHREQAAVAVVLVQQEEMQMHHPHLEVTQVMEH
jgi:hypothetical protein